MLEAQTSEMKANIDALPVEFQVEQAENKLRRLREEEADHRRVLAPFRNLPEDVLREIGIACVQGDIPELSFSHTPMPYMIHLRPSL